MAKLYRSREGLILSADTKTQLTVLGSQTAPGALLVPGSMSFLEAAIVTFGSEMDAAESSALLLRLEGPGISRGNFVCAAGGLGAQVATGASGAIPAVRIPIGIKVTPGQEVLVFSELLGTDPGTTSVGITLVFSTELGGAPEIKSEITVEGEVTGESTLTRLTTQGSVSAPSRLTPPDATKITRLVAAAGADGAAGGSAAMLVRLGGDAIKGGEQTIFVCGLSSQTVQTGSDTAGLLVAPNVLENIDIEVTPNETLDISAEMIGVDIGDTTIVVTAMFE
jgi:hypothetical protein